MLSYRHAFHAGNPADVLKHLVLRQLLLYLNQKDKPWQFVDTHAGAGMYALDHGFAAKNAEFEDGIGRLWSEQNLPPALADYVALVRRLNPDGTLRCYPGSPRVALESMRPDDRLRLFELHSGDFRLLEEHFRGAGKRVKVEQADGFAALKAVLPPVFRRGLVLIDPPYELKEDYRRVPAALAEALKRFQTGLYAVWYPQLQRLESRQFPEQLKRLPAENWLHVSLTLHAPAPDGFGMHGSGLFILNPPWTLASTLQQVMPSLVELLGEGADASYQIEVAQDG